MSAIVHCYAAGFAAIYLRNSFPSLVIPTGRTASGKEHLREIQKYNAIRITNIEELCHLRRKACRLFLAPMVSYYWILV